MKSSSHSALPPDRVIITAHYEVKKEEDDEDEDPLLSAAHHDPEALETEAPFSEVAEPAAKRQRTDGRAPNTRRVIRDEEAEEDEAENQPSDKDRGMRGTGHVRDDAKNDFDEMAIGAEASGANLFGKVLSLNRA